MLPEISRRCAWCGSSIREPGMFCPECGKPLSQAAEASGPHVVADASAPPVVKAAPDDAAPTPQPSTASTGTQESATIEAKPDQEEPGEPPTKLSEPARIVVRPGSSRPGGKHEKARERLHRASTATREALADNVKRVEKIRNVSSAMIEEATYDPSLRFVLVALALFVIFLLLLLLSKVMG